MCDTSGSHGAYVAVARAVFAAKLQRSSVAPAAFGPSDQSRRRKWVSPLGPPGSRCATKSVWLVGVAAAIHEIEIDELIGSQLRYRYGGSQTDACFRSTLTDGS
jgi:hypothetical protein